MINFQKRIKVINFISRHCYSTIIFLNHINLTVNNSNFAKNQNSKTNNIEIGENL